MTIVVEGKKIAKAMQHRLAEKVAHIDGQLFFHIVYVGSDPVIENYLSYKEKYAAAIGVEVVVHRFPESISENDLLHEISVISEKKEPMIVQLPLPETVSTRTIVDAVPASLDVDVLSSEARALFVEGEQRYVPPVVGSVLEIFDYYSINLEAKKILVVGSGNLVGAPMVLWLQSHNYPYELVTKDDDEDRRNTLLAEADVIISGAGVPGLITPDCVKEGVIIVDAGTSESGSRIVGDVDPQVKEKSSLFTPVPGGIGPLTIAVLYRNVIHSYLYV